ncbi:MAG: hypothetical protein U5L09_11030 [Bacteroidales bacterium]|nr:hypothetical protein [Bacteroidales bacterium]
MQRTDLFVKQKLREEKKVRSTALKVFDEEHAALQLWFSLGCFLLQRVRHAVALVLFKLCGL